MRTSAKTNVLLVSALFVTLVFATKGAGPLAAQNQPQFQPVVFWNPVIEMDGNLFPSYLIATSRLSNSTCPAATGRRFGDSLGVIGVVLAQLPAGVHTIRVEVKENDILRASECEASLQFLDFGVDKDIEIFPKIDYRSDALRRVRQSVPVNIAIEVFADGRSVGQQISTAWLRSINDCPFFISSQDGSPARDLRYMFAAYVNEYHPWNDSIRREALRLDLVNHFVGYQAKDTQEVYAQVEALWEVLQRGHITYSDIALADTSYGHVVSQHVRLVDEAIHFAQANCADGSILFASLLKQIGIDPILVIVPGHMFVGFYLDPPEKRARRVAYLETTMLGTVDLARLPGDSGVNTLGRAVASSSSFWRAIRRAGGEMDSTLSARLRGDPRFVEIDLAEVRALGIIPISFEGSY